MLLLPVSNFWKTKALINCCLKQIFDTGKLFIQCNKDNCCKYLCVISNKSTWEEEDIDEYNHRFFFNISTLFSAKFETGGINNIETFSRNKGEG